MEGLSLIEMVNVRHGPKRALPSRKNSLSRPVPCEDSVSILDVRVDSASMDLVFLTAHSTSTRLFDSSCLADNRADNHDGASKLSSSNEARVKEEEE